MSFAQTRSEDRRLLLLHLLLECPGYSSSNYPLTSAANTMGHFVSHDVIRSDLAWLAEQGLITCKTIEDVVIATLAVRGIDVSAGRASVPGVRRPLPG